MMVIEMNLFRAFLVMLTTKGALNWSHIYPFAPTNVQKFIHQHANL